MDKIKKTGKKKILLAILPYWDPMIPPTGIASLKTFLQKHGYTVKIVDYIVAEDSLDFYASVRSTYIQFRRARVDDWEGSEEPAEDEDDA
ncbi:MAG: VacJ family lipoprotein, partial [bacterium]|nr:VacJ family lipoprotein [bacterium]